MNGASTAPRRCRTCATFAKRSSFRRKTSAPPCTSLWPPKYFVVEWSTMSAPSSSGRWSAGVANVLSTSVERARLLRERRDRREVGDLHQRVRRRLHEDQLRLRPERLRDGREVVHRAERRREAPRREELLPDRAPAVVRVVREEDVRAARKRLEHRDARPPCPSRGRAPPRRPRAARARPRGASAWDSTRGCRCGRRAGRPSRRARTSSRGGSAARRSPSPPPVSVPREPPASRTSWVLRRRCGTMPA